MKTVLASLLLSSSLLAACGSGDYDADFGSATRAERMRAMNTALGVHAMQTLKAMDAAGPQPARVEASLVGGLEYSYTGTVVRERLDSGGTRITVDTEGDTSRHYWIASHLAWTCGAGGGCTLEPGGTVELSTVGIAEVYAEVSAFNPGAGVIELRGADTMRTDVEKDTRPDGVCTYVAIDGERQPPLCNSGWAGVLVPPPPAE